MDEQIASIIPHKGRIITNKEELVIHYRINLKHVCLWAVTIPLVALVVCLVSSYIFQYDDVHETHCRVSIFIFEIFSCFHLHFIFWFRYLTLYRQ